MSHLPNTDNTMNPITGSVLLCLDITPHPVPPPPSLPSTPGIFKPGSMNKLVKMIKRIVHLRKEMDLKNFIWKIVIWGNLPHPPPFSLSLSLSLSLSFTHSPSLSVQDVSRFLKLIGVWGQKTRPLNARRCSMTLTEIKLGLFVSYSPHNKQTVVR